MQSRIGRVCLTGVTRRQASAIVGLVTATAVGLAILSPLANADELTDKRDEVNAQISQTKKDLNESSEELTAAAVALEQAQGQLEAAQAELAQTQAALAEAQQRDIEMAAKLKVTRADLAKAKAAVVAGQKKLDAEEAVAGDMVRQEYQQQTNLLPIALLLENTTTGDLANRMQLSSTMFDTTKAAIDALTAAQRKLNAERAKQTMLEKRAAEERAEAAVNLQVSEDLEAQAEQQAANVASLVEQRSTAEAAAQDAVAADKERYSDLSAERVSVEKRIAERIAKAKAEAARKKEAARQARIAAEKEAAAERAREAEREAKERAAAKRADSKKESSSNKQSGSSKSAGSKSAKKSSKSKAKKASKKSKKTSSWSNSSSSSSSASHGFDFPVNAPITSPYGMRLHPVLGYWKLHDGTDFGAGCGTAIRAPYSGTVSEKYFNAGYGNRLLIDHGEVDGRYITTAYNHAIRYTIGVGDRVSKGEVIGYVGSTGYSTGCHLHLMVYRDGTMINPMNWF